MHLKRPLQPRAILLVSAVATVFYSACTESTSPPVPARLAFTSQPSGLITAGNLLTFVVTIQDANGKAVESASNTVTMTLTTAEGISAMSGITTVSAVAGVATFSGLVINKAASGYRLTASSANLPDAVTVPFSVIAGPVSKLAFTSEPATTIARTAIPNIQVSVQDAVGNVVVTSAAIINLRLVGDAGGATLLGSTSLSANRGIANFQGVMVSEPGSGYTIAAEASGLSAAVSKPFDQTVGAATQLAFLSDPPSTSPGAAIEALSVAVKDAAGNTIKSATNSITLSIGTNSETATLSGTTTMTAVQGVATFSDISIDKRGTYILSATTVGLNPGTSRPFTVREALRFVSITSGYFHSCGRDTNGIAWCWGQNSEGQLGSASPDVTLSPVAVSGNLLFGMLGAGRNHTCGVADVIGYCWGGNVGAGIPSTVPGGLSFVSVLAGYGHSCGVTTSHTGYCWGVNASGELGNGTQEPSIPPVLVSGNLVFQSVTPGRGSTCGLTSGGAAYCWGDAGFGNAVTLTPTRVPGTADLEFSIVSTGGFHACALTKAGRAYCWGQNSGGQLGNGGSPNSNSAGPVAGGLEFVTLSAGNRHTCALTAAGAAWCWGSGIMGDGTGDIRYVPVAVAGGHNFVSISAGRFHTCAVTTTGDGYCWGENGSGQLGDGTTSLRLLPTLVH